MNIHLIVFNKKYMNSEKIVEKNFVKINSNMKDNFDDLIILIINDETKGIKILSSLVSIQKINICICISRDLNYYNIINFLQKFQVNYSFYSFTTYDFDLIPFVTCYKEMRKLYNFKRVLNLSTYRNQDFFINNQINKIQSGGILKENIKEIDHFNVTMIGNLINLNKTMKWNKECVYLEDKEYYDLLFYSYPFQEIFEKCLFITQTYDNYVTPRCSPYHSLERIIGFMKSKINDKKSLAIFVVKIDNDDDLEKIKNNIKYF